MKNHRFFAWATAICFLLTLPAGCSRAPDGAPPAAADIGTAGSAETAAVMEDPAPVDPFPETVREPMPENAVDWRSVFSDRSLPEDGYLTQTQVAFYRKDENGSASVRVMTIPEILEGAANPEPIPRTRFFENQLDENYTLLFSCLDIALTQGCRKFCFPTAELRSWEISDHMNEINYTFPISNARLGFSATKDYRAEDGSSFHYMTVSFNNYDYTYLLRYRTALDKAREIVREMPESLTELEKAKYLYVYAAKNIRYDYDDYYEDADWNPLYDALVEGSTVCTGFSEALYCLFNLAGIDCLYVDGVVSFENVADFHAWNYAKVDGAWYLFDSTWDSATIDLLDGGILYFGLSDRAAEFYSTRKLFSYLSDLVPSCDEILDPDALYFVPPT